MTRVTRQDFQRLLEFRVALREFQQGTRDITRWLPQPSIRRVRASRHRAVRARMTSGPARR